MGKIAKIVLSVLGIGVICFGLFIYFSFAGTPWNKIYYKYQLKDYLANKYNEEMVITKSIYNFKDGKYGVQAYPKNNPELKFSAWQHYDKTKQYRDYYPEAIWHQQINSEFKDILEEYYPDATRKEFHGVMGISTEMNIQSEIPHYSEVEHFFTLVIHEDKKLEQEIKIAEVDRLYSLIKKIEEKDVTTDVLIVYRDKNVDSKNCEKYININMKDNRKYPTKEEIEEIYNEELKRELFN